MTSMTSQSSASEAPTRPIPALRPSVRRAIFSVLLIIGVLMMVIAGSAFAGYRAGLAERDRRAHEASQQAADEQFSLALQDMSQGRYELARQRFEYVLGVNPGYAGATEQLAEVMRLMNATPLPEPTSTAETTPAEVLFTRAVARSRMKDWEGAIDALTALRGIDPAYQVILADGLMFVALRNRGLERIQSGLLELGLYDLYQAEQVGPLDAEADGYRLWAELYLAADSYWGLNWERAAYYFGELYTSAPYFLDTFDRLYQSTRNYADQLAAAGDYCPAQEWYAEAQSLRIDADVADRLATAQANCQSATPTPEPGATPTASP